jgi:hypothetical protein
MILLLLFSKEFSAVTAALQLNSEATGIGLITCVGKPVTRSSRVVGCHPKLVILLNFGVVKDLDWVFLCRLSSACAHKFCFWFVD